MKILFMARHFGCLRNFDRAIQRLTERGHKLHLVAHTGDILHGQEMVERWAAQNPAITFERLPEPPATGWTELSLRLRLMVDYLRYLQPAYREAPRLVERARIRTPNVLLHALKWRILRTRLGRSSLSRLLLVAERAVPRRPEVDEFLRRRAPDLVLFTPLLALGSEELDYLDAAEALGMRTVFCVWSWDNLSSKALLRSVPDAVLVWNETQKQEAMELHRVPANRIAITGAQSFDQWFDRRPERSRQEFCARVGLPHDPPFLLWVCSALFKGSPPEAEFVRRWLVEIRASADPVLRNVPILVRPHPARRKEWQAVSLDGLGPVSLWGDNPVDPASKADYFESLYYSAAVVGLNTSAFLEAAIVGKPVYTVLLPEHYENQEGTIHFHYLLNIGGGLLHAQRSVDAHLAELAAALRQPAVAVERSRRFVEAFVRPLGAKVEASERFVEVVERTGALGAEQPQPEAWWVPALRVLLQRFVGEPSGEDIRWRLLSPREIDEQRRKAERLASMEEERRLRIEGRLRAQQERLRLKRIARAEKIKAHQERKAEERAREKQQRAEHAAAARSGKGQGSA